MRIIRGNSFTGSRTWRCAIASACTLLGAVAWVGALLGCERSDSVDASATTHDFGTRYLDLGQILLTHTFSLVNDTDASLQVVDMKKTCGCVQAELAETTLAPGASTTLRTGVELASTGPLQQSVSLIFSDGSAKRYTLTAFGAMKQELVAIPTTVQLDPRTKTAALELYIIDHSGAGQASAPEVLRPKTVALEFDGWRTLERQENPGGRPERQLASLSLNFSRYTGAFPVDVQLQTQSGASCKVTVTSPPG